MIFKMFFVEFLWDSGIVRENFYHKIQKRNKMNRWTKLSIKYAEKSYLDDLFFKRVVVRVVFNLSAH